MQLTFFGGYKRMCVQIKVVLFLSIVQLPIFRLRALCSESTPTAFDRVYNLSYKLNEHFHLYSNKRLNSLIAMHKKLDKKRQLNTDEPARKKSRLTDKPIDHDNGETVRSSSEEDEIDTILKKKRASYRLPQDKVEILRAMVIKLRHEVLPQHKIERASGTRVPSVEEKKMFKKIVRSKYIKKGTFTAEEDIIIVKNWEAFCELHDWTVLNPKPFLFLRHHYDFYLPKKEERKKFVQFLADGLPGRTLYSVYHRFRNLYEPHLTHRYSHEDDQYIIKYIEQKKNIDETRKFADLAKILDRTRASVWRRYRLLKKKRTEMGEEDA